MKIVAFGASYSSQSINKKLAFYVASQFENAELVCLDLNHFPLPLYSVDVEKSIGIPEEAKQFVAILEHADLIIVSLAEHNGTYTTGFKNLFDWISRCKNKFFENKKVFLLSTSPGPRGGLGAMEAAQIRFPIHGAELVGTFVLPSFSQNFDEEQGIKGAILADFKETLAEVKSHF